MKRLELLDYARMAAALSVVAFHYFFQAVLTGEIPLPMHQALAQVAKYGYLGVELFFLISGYVIFLSANGKTAGEFAASRAARLYPAFWASAILTSVVLWLAGSAPSLRQLLANLSMLPKLFRVEPLDGVYWTLMWEVSFYAAVALILLTPLRRRLEAVFMCWPVAMLLARMFELDSLPYMGGFYPFFAAGVLLAISRERVTPVLVASLLGAFVLCVDGTLARALTSEARRGVHLDPAVIVGVLAAQFAFFVLLNTRRAQRLRLPGSRVAGALTYPVYLVHNAVGISLLAILAPWLGAGAYLLVLAVVLWMAYALHVFVERRMDRVWRGFFYRLVCSPLDRIDRGLRALVRSAPV